MFRYFYTFKTIERIFFEIHKENELQCIPSAMITLDDTGLTD